MHSFDKVEKPPPKRQLKTELKVQIPLPLMKYKYVMTLIQWFVFVLMTLMASRASLELMLKMLEQLLAFSVMSGLEER